MRWPWVSRSALDRAEAEAKAWQDACTRAEARYHEVWEKFCEVTKPKEPRAIVVQPAKSPEEKLRVVEDGFVKRLKQDLLARGLPEGVAQMEAERIRRESASTFTPS